MQNPAKLDTLNHMELVRLHNRSMEMQTGKKPLAYTHHYGCQQNVSDGEKIDGMLTEMGYEFCGSPNDADIVLYNTCAVRGTAEDRIYGNVGALKHAKRRNPDMTIAICGCMVQQKHVEERFKKSFPYVDMLFGPSAIADFPRLLYGRLTEGGRFFDILNPTGEIPEELPIRRAGQVKAFVPIMYGCNNFCTYCIVPYVRGRERSRNAVNIISEIGELVSSGYKDITLLGQNVNSYYSDGTSFTGLLKKIEDIPGDFRLRFMTSHPKDCSKELIDHMAVSKKLCKHLHLPVQSGSNRILGLMNRRYTAERYRETIAYAREKIPDITITSDIIVGFPGETESDFLETLKLVQNTGYLSLFTFVYSKREGTQAAGYEDTATGDEKKKWFQSLLDIQNTLSKNMYEGYIGKTVRVLAEGKDGGKARDGYLAGRSDSNIIVNFIGDEALIGKFADVKITGAPGWALIGEIEKRETGKDE